jgi:hypothetical protein
MKTSLVAVLVCVAGLLPGCAQRNQAITAQPTAEELPVSEQHTSTSAMVVGVEHRPVESTARLVPDFKSPEPTAEEKAALGEEPPRHNFLPYNVFRTFGTHVGTWFGGLSTATSGLRGAAVAVDPAPRNMVGVQGAGGATTAVDPAGSATGRVQPERTSVAKTGPEGGVRVGTDPVAKRTGGRRP